MALEEQNRRGSNGSNGAGAGVNNNNNKSSKKQKGKKVPQRGLGVAQLEKIRIEELQKKNAAALMAATAAATLLPPSPSISNGTVPLANPGMSDVLEYGTADRALEFDSLALDSAFARYSNMNLSGESDHVLPPILRLKREYLNQVNMIVPSAPPTPSQSSNFRMEPPSNQNYHYNSYTRFVPEVEKVNLLTQDAAQVVGTKMPYPPISHGSGNFRDESKEILSFPGSSSVRESNLSRGSSENGSLGEDLTLGHPSASSSWLNLRLMDPPPANLAWNNQNTFLDHESRRIYQQQQYYYSFLPPAIPEDTREETSSRTGDGEDQESLDLELRL